MLGWTPGTTELASTIKPGKQPNMMHLTGDGRRMYITNSLLSTMDPDTRFWVRLARISDKGMAMDEALDIDLNKVPGGPFRGHDMLLN